jgi:hypothetical protein
MHVIWKYPLEATDVQMVKMPKGAKILCVQTQGQTPCLWALIPDTKATLEERHFSIYGTGHLHEKIPGTYIGTFQLMNGQLVFHVFETEASHKTMRKILW